MSRTGPKTERLKILRAATHETELGDHDFCLSRSHYTSRTGKKGLETRDKDDHDVASDPTSLRQF